MNASYPPTLSRREWFSVAAHGALLPLLVRGLHADELSGFYYRDYSRCLPDYLSALAHSAYEQRNHQLAALTTASAIRERQRWVRETFWKLIGAQPERTPLNARTTGQFDRSGYRVEKVVYESRPGIVISANLYVPTTGKPPFPGVLFQMGHYYSGKANAGYQKCCQGLARLGYVVLAFDPMGQGERIAYPDASGTNTRLNSVDEEHSVPGKQMLLVGDSATRYQVWDAIRSLDYLGSHPAVNPERLASTGQSGGGTLTMLLACVDDRLSAAAVSSGNTENFACPNFNPPGATDDAEQNLIGSSRAAFDRWDLLYPIAPKPLLILVSAHDFFGTYSPRYLDNSREEYEKLSKVYETLGHPERLEWRSTPLPHALSYGLRLEIYNWFERWLKNSEMRIDEEPPVAPEAETMLQVGPAGNVARDFRSLRPFDLIKRNAADLRRPSDPRAWIQALNLTFPARELTMSVLAQTALEAVRVKATEINSAPEVWLPAWLFTSEKSNPSRSTLIVLDDRGRNAQAREDGLYHRLAQSGRPVYAADIRGIGDTRPEVGRGNPNYTIRHDSEEEFAWASLILGDSLLAQRITDILAIMQALANEPAIGRQLAIAARGRLTVPALFACAIAERVSSLYLAEGLVSYQNLLETESYRQPLANFAWDLFRYTDLPLLASQAAPRRIFLAGVVDASNNRMSPDAVRNIYSSPNVHISAEPKWDEAALSAI